MRNPKTQAFILFIYIYLSLNSKSDNVPFGRWENAGKEMALVQRFFRIAYAIRFKTLFWIL